jgi:hypothetical protein
LYQPKAEAVKESKEFTEKRKRQKSEDEGKGLREKGGRQMQNVPEEFIFLTRVIGLLRGLTAELDCSCPIMHILALHAHSGLKQ